MRFHWFIAAGCAVAAPSSANLLPPPDDPIVVTGQSPATARKQARAYVRELGVANGEQPAARWMVPVCPRVVGIDEKQTAWVTRHLREVAMSVRAPLAKEGCEPNFFVIFTADADRVVDILAKRPPGQLGHPGSTAARKIKKGGMPVRWWYNVRLQTNFAVPDGADHNPAAKFSDMFGNEAPPPGNSETTITQHYSASLVSTQVGRGIQSARVIVDVNRINSARLASVSDFAALVGLAEIQLGAAPSNSILSLFSPAPDNLSLSARDMSFLTGLYRISMDREAPQHRRMLVHEMLAETSPERE